MINEPAKNKMMESAPAKKGWHFSSDGVHLAEYIYADTLEEATAIYHRIKKSITITSTTQVAPKPPEPPVKGESHDTDEADINNNE